MPSNSQPPFKSRTLYYKEDADRVEPERRFFIVEEIFLRKNPCFSGNSVKTLIL